MPIKKEIEKKLSPELAFIKIQSWCAYQERCQQEVRYKLYEYGLWTDAVEGIISELIQLNFLNEERFAMQFTQGKFNIKKWGREKIKIELKRKQVSDYCIKKALIQINDELYIETLLKLLNNKRKLIAEKHPLKLKHKLVNYALSKGYENDLVMQAVNAQF